MSSARATPTTASLCSPTPTDRVGAVPDTLSDERLVEVLQRYLTILQGHPSAEEMMAETLTQDFETGFIGGQVWKGIDGLRDFLSQRHGFFDEKHTIEELLERGETTAALLPAQLEVSLAGQRGVHGHVLPPLAGSRGGRRVASGGPDGGAIRRSK